MRNLAAIFILLMEISAHPSGLRSTEISEKIVEKNSRKKFEFFTAKINNASKHFEQMSLADGSRRLVTGIF